MVPTNQLTNKKRQIYSLRPCNLTAFTFLLIPFHISSLTLSLQVISIVLQRCVAKWFGTVLFAYATE